MWLVALYGQVHTARHGEATKCGIGGLYCVMLRPAAIDITCCFGKAFEGRGHVVCRKIPTRGALRASVQDLKKTDQRMIMKTTSVLLGTMLMACSALAMAQSTGGSVGGNGSGMTRTQANSTTMGVPGVPGAMGNASGTADTQGVGNMSSSNDAVSPASTSIHTNSTYDSNSNPAAPSATPAPATPKTWTDNGPARWDQN
jgi:hypothetical protein